MADVLRMQDSAPLRNGIVEVDEQIWYKYDPNDSGDEETDHLNQFALGHGGYIALVNQRKPRAPEERFHTQLVMLSLSQTKTMSVRWRAEVCLRLCSVVSFATNSFSLF